MSNLQCKKYAQTKKANFENSGCDFELKQDYDVGISWDSGCN